MPALSSAAVQKFMQWPADISTDAIALAFGFAALTGVFFGFYPAPLQDVSNPMVGDLLEQVGVQDDAPTVDPGDAPEHETEEAH